MVSGSVLTSDVRSSVRSFRLRVCGAMRFSRSDRNTSGVPPSLVFATPVPGCLTKVVRRRLEHYWRAQSLYLGGDDPAKSGQGPAFRKVDRRAQRCRRQFSTAADGGELDECETDPIKTVIWPVVAYRPSSHGRAGDLRTVLVRSRLKKQMT